MLASIKQRLKDINTLRHLFLTAEACARAEGVAEPGAEHLVMASLTLPDQSATRAFQRIGADGAEFASAVTQQYADALTRIGVDAGAHLVCAPELPNRPDRTEAFKSQPSARSLVQKLAREKRFGARQPLLGADIVLAALANDVGAVARALTVMGVEPHMLADACRLEIGGSEVAQ